MSIGQRKDKPSGLTECRSGGSIVRDSLQKSRAEALLQLAVRFSSPAATSSKTSLCSGCGGFHYVPTSTASFATLFCSKECEHKFVRTVLAGLTHPDCLCMEQQLDELLSTTRLPPLGETG